MTIINHKFAAEICKQVKNLLIHTTMSTAELTAHRILNNRDLQKS